MADNRSFRCECPACQGPDSASTRELHALIRCFLSTLDQRQQRLYAGLEAAKRGRGGERYLARITEIAEETIIAGQRELRVAALGVTPPGNERALANDGKEPQTCASVGKTAHARGINTDQYRKKP